MTHSAGILMVTEDNDVDGYREYRQRIAPGHLFLSGILTIYSIRISKVIMDTDELFHWDINCYARC